MAIRVILTDIEGTTTPIAFVHSVLFPYARAALPDFLHAHGRDAAMADVMADIARLAPDVDPLSALLAWMDIDAKITPLKTLQGLIWAEGYRSGAITSVIYPDVTPCLRAWHGAGLRLAIYSSGSVGAQKLLFGHTPDGDLTPLFSDFFDTRVGGKRDAASYAAIASALALPADSILFLSDIGAELDAAALSGLRTAQLLRPQDGTQTSPAHRGFSNFADIAADILQPSNPA